MLYKPDLHLLLSDFFFNIFNHSQAIIFDEHIAVFFSFQLDSGFFLEKTKTKRAFMRFFCNSKKGFQSIVHC